MIHNRRLPLWVHRACNGAFGAAVLVGGACIWFGEPEGSWRHTVSLGLIWMSIPVGITLAVVAHRFSFVRGIAGGEGYDELNHTVDNKPQA